MRNEYRCPLSKFSEPSMDTERVKREGWRDEKILVVSLDDPRLSKFQRGLVLDLGNDLYGDVK
jgi:predicted enzyme involved in methoxymalonyl-ACP biosynthesis